MFAILQGLLFSIALYYILSAQQYVVHCCLRFSKGDGCRPRQASQVYGDYVEMSLYNWPMSMTTDAPPRVECYVFTTFCMLLFLYMYNSETGKMSNFCCTPYAYKTHNGSRKMEFLLLLTSLSYNVYYKCPHSSPLSRWCLKKQQIFSWSERGLHVVSKTQHFQYHIYQLWLSNLSSRLHWREVFTSEEKEEPMMQFTK